MTTADEKADALVARLRHLANANRLRHGMPAWNFDQIRAVPSCGHPPI